MCLRRGENPCGGGGEGEFNAFSFSSGLVRRRRNAPDERQREKRRAKRRERKMRTSDWANTRGGCCCCGRGITSAPLTRKTFRLNLVLDSARLLSTHPNRTAFLARPKRSANPFPYPPILYKCYQTAVGPPPNRRHSVCRVYLTPFRSYQHK